MNQRQRRILAVLAQSPREMTWFTHSTSGLNDLRIGSAVMELYFAQMEQLGYIGQDRGLYFITARGRDFLGKERPTTGSREYTNSASTETYKPPQWWVRPGGEDHKQYKSLGT